MEIRTKVLGIAPYESMRDLMVEEAQKYPEVELTVFVGDLQQGVRAGKTELLQ